MEDRLRSVMLTGATGFIGSHLAERLLQEGFHLSLWIRRWTAFIASMERAGAQVFLGDPDDDRMLAAALRGADVVVHCAGTARAHDRAGYFATNAGLTRRILGLLQAPQKMVFISSQAAAGPSGTDGPLDEGAVPRPISHYGQSKLEAEECVRRWGAANGERYVILRPSVVYGPGERDLYNLFKWIKKGVLPFMGDGLQKVSLVHVDDLVAAVMAVLEDSHPGQTYFVTGSEHCSVRALGSMIQEVLRKGRVLPLSIPPGVFDALASILDAVSCVTGAPALLSRQKTLEMKQPAWLCSNRKLRETLAWEPRMSLRRGIEQTVEWYVREKWL
ncbi:MAG: NAD-dependent epimerase/dehydratase family protein [Syntrophobacteraceae bacterium]